MQHRSVTAGAAVSLAVLLAASAFVWAEFGAFAVSVIRAMAGG